ncbi:MAG TPA: beta-propeller fold lactonase family protein [Kofleriaceae bacterium]|nr:beta-propeller fold lactonase family protein [Kofleriaceae bacterium]
MSATFLGRTCSHARAGAVVAILLATACRSQPAASRLFVSNESAGTVSVIDAHSTKTLATIPVGDQPRGLRVSRDGRTLFVALRGAHSIGVVDLTQLRLVDTIPSGRGPEAFDLVGDRFIVVSNEETQAATIVDVNARKVRATITVGNAPDGVAAAPDGSVWITNEADNTVSVIDPRAARVVATLATGMRPRGIAFNHKLGVVTGESDASVTIVDIAAREAIARVQLPMTGVTPPQPVGVAIDAAGRYAYVTTGNAGSIAVIDLEAHRLARVIEHVGHRPSAITLGRDGLLYTANGPGNDIAAIDPRSGLVVRRIAAGDSPGDITSL